MGLNSLQVEILRNKLANLKPVGQYVCETVDHFLLKVKSWGEAFIDNPEQNTVQFHKVCTNIDMVTQYLTGKAAEIIMGNLTDVEDFTLESTEAIKMSFTCGEVATFTPSTSPSESSETLSGHETDDNMRLMTEMQNDDVKETVNRKEQITENPTARVVDRMENLVKEKTDMLKTIEEKFKEFENYQLILKEWITQCEKIKTIEAEKTMFYQLKADVAEMKEMLRQAKEDGRETAMAFRKRLMLLEDKIEEGLEKRLMLLEDKIEEGLEKRLMLLEDKIMEGLEKRLLLPENKTEVGLQKLVTVRLTMALQKILPL